MGKNKRYRMEIQGQITEAYKGGCFDVMLETGAKVYASVCGKMRKSFIKVVPGDDVMIEVSPYDPTKGRIVRRLKEKR